MTPLSLSLLMETRVLDKKVDLHAFKALRIEAVLDTPEAFGESSSEVTLRGDESFIYNLSDHNRGDFVVGTFDHNNLIGVAGFYREAFEKFRHKGNIWGVYVTPTYRGQGLGKPMLGKVIETVRARTNVKQLRLTVVTKNVAAVQLYQSLGFKIFGTELQSLNLDDVFYDEHYMQLQL